MALLSSWIGGDDAGGGDCETPKRGITLPLVGDGVDAGMMTAGEGECGTKPVAFGLRGPDMVGGKLFFVLCLVSCMSQSWDDSSRLQRSLGCEGESKPSEWPTFT